MQRRWTVRGREAADGDVTGVTRRRAPGPSGQREAPPMKGMRPESDTSLRPPGGSYFRLMGVTMGEPTQGQKAFLSGLAKNSIHLQGNRQFLLPEDERRCLSPPRTNSRLPPECSPLANAGFKSISKLSTDRGNFF